MSKKSMYLKIGLIILGCTVLSILSEYDLIITDEDRFLLNNGDSLRMIDIEKTGPDIVVPEKVGDDVIRDIYLADPYFSKVDSIDVSNVKGLEYFELRLYGAGSRSKLKRLDFSKNKKLKMILVNRTMALEEIVFNENCKSISLNSTAVKNLDLKGLKNLDRLVYYYGPLEELDISDNPELETLRIVNTKIKSLDISKNPELKELRLLDSDIDVIDVSNNPELETIDVDEGTRITGATDAQIKYWSEEDLERLRETLS